MHLNQSQSLAVHHEGSPLLIVAGAGTGKTTVITERIKHLIQDKHIDPQRLFAATFTQKAAGEMLERLDDVMPLGYQEPWLGTFHALADRLLRLEGLEIGLNPTYQVMTQTDEWLFLKQHLGQLKLNYYRPLGNPNKFISALITFFSRLSDEAITPAEFSHSLPALIKDSKTEIEGQRLTELSRAYDLFDHLKREASVMDFGDLMLYVLRLLQERPNILAKYRDYFSHILVDEFQDTNYAQFELIKLLSPPAQDTPITVVGDDDQSVYRFRGASISNILDFKAVYPHATEVVLTHNYRSTQPILDAAYNVIINNNPDRLEVKLGINKKLVSTVPAKPTPLPPETHEFATTEAEVDWTAHEIVRLVTSQNLAYQDIAVLARSNSVLEGYAATLKNYGIPYQLVSNRGLFDQEEITNLIYFLTTLTNPRDSLALFPLTQLPLFHCDPHRVFSLLSTAKIKSTSLWDELQSDTDPTMQAFVSVITKYQGLAANQTVRQVLYQFVLDTGYVDQYLKKETVENQLKIKNLNLFFNRIKQFEAVTRDRSVLNFLATLDLWLEAGENPGQAQVEDIDTVKLMTVHAAKGLEFEAVFIGSLVAGRFPSYSKKDLIEVPLQLIKEHLPEGDFHLQEERRLFYVALTRAKRYLHLTYALDTGGVRQRKTSGFVSEANLSSSTVTQLPLSLNLAPSTKPHLAQVIEGGKYQITSLSYSKIDTFKVCPLKFKYRYLLQIPARPHHAMSFGRSIHTALHLFHTDELKGKHPQKADLLRYFETNFIEEGYESSEHKQARFQSGLKALERYYSQYQSLLGKPVMLEQAFNLRLGNVTLIGKIDRIDRHPDGSYELVDYKTGTPKDQKSVDKDAQLTLYALASETAFHLKPKQLSLYFLEAEADATGKVSTTRTPSQLASARTNLLDQIETIRQSDFPAKPSEFACHFCEYARLCPFATKK